jgi:hypothetical protein
MLMPNYVVARQKKRAQLALRPFLAHTLPQVLAEIELIVLQHLFTGSAGRGCSYSRSWRSDIKANDEVRR